MFGGLVSQSFTSWLRYPHGGRYSAKKNPNWPSPKPSSGLSRNMPSAALMDASRERSDTDEPPMTDCSQPLHSKAPATTDSKPTQSNRMVTSPLRTPLV